MRLNPVIKPKCTYTMFFVAVLSVLGFQCSFGQNSQNIKTYNEVQKSLQNKSADNSKLLSLLSDEQAAAYFVNSTENVYGTSPLILYTDLRSLVTVKSVKFVTNSIQLISIKVDSSENLRNITLSKDIFQGFTNLKYIYFLFDNDVSDVDVQGLIDWNSADLVIFYQVIKGS